MNAFYFVFIIIVAVVIAVVVGVVAVVGGGVGTCRESTRGEGRKNLLATEVVPSLLISFH